MSEPEPERRLRPALMRAVSLCVVVAVVALAYQPGLAVQFWRGGLRPCHNLEKRLCADLGPKSCAVWKNDLGGAFAGSGQPHPFLGRKSVPVDKAVHALLGWDAAHQDNPLCYEQLEDASYAQVLSTIRGAVQSRPETP